MYLWLHIKCLIFLPDFNQILNLSTDFHRSPQHQISPTSVQWKPCWYLRTERQMPTAWYHLHSRTVLLWWLNVASNNKTYIHIHVQFLTLFPDFNQIWVFLADFYTHPQYQTSWKSIYWEQRWYIRADGSKEVLFAIMRMQLKIDRDMKTTYCGGSKDDHHHQCICSSHFL
jgi:hypothetical protein